MAGENGAHTGNRFHYVPLDKAPDEQSPKLHLHPYPPLKGRGLMDHVRRRRLDPRPPGDVEGRPGAGRPSTSAALGAVIVTP